MFHIFVSSYLQVFIGVTEKKPFKRHQMMNEIAYEKVIEQACMIYLK